MSCTVSEYGKWPTATDGFGHCPVVVMTLCLLGTWSWTLIATGFNYGDAGSLLRNHATATAASSEQHRNARVANLRMRLRLTGSRSCVLSFLPFISLTLVWVELDFLPCLRTRAIAVLDRYLLRQGHAITQAS